MNELAGIEFKRDFGEYEEEYYEKEYEEGGRDALMVRPNASLTRPNEEEAAEQKYDENILASIISTNNELEEYWEENFDEFDEDINYLRMKNIQHQDYPLAA